MYKYLLTAAFTLFMYQSPVLAEDYGDDMDIESQMNEGMDDDASSGDSQDMSLEDTGDASDMTEDSGYGDDGQSMYQERKPKKHKKKHPFGQHHKKKKHKSRSAYGDDSMSSGDGEESFAENDSMSDDLSYGDDGQSKHKEKKAKKNKKKHKKKKGKESQVKKHKQSKAHSQKSHSQKSKGKKHKKSKKSHKSSSFL